VDTGRVPILATFTGMLQPDVEGGHFLPSTAEVKNTSNSSHTSLRGVQLDTVENLSFGVLSSAMHVFKLICHSFFYKTYF
jgi:hypothetical protein